MKTTAMDLIFYVMLVLTGFMLAWCLEQ